MKKLLLYLVGLVLFAAVLLQAYAFTIRPDITKEEKLDDLISTHLPGWTMEELPLGQTEEVVNAVENTLRFDDVISRVYTSGLNQVGIYIAYWEPGKVPVRMIGVHTPDTCWIQNGWSCTERESNLRHNIGGKELKPAEWGIFETEQHRQHVLFWHLVGARVHTYEQQGLHSLTAAFQDMLQYGLNQRQEQYFIRISSNRPFGEIWDDPGFIQLMQDIGELGLTQSDVVGS